MLYKEANRKIPIKKVKMEKNQTKNDVSFSYPKDHSTQFCFRFLGQKVWPVAQAQTDRHTDRHTEIFPSTYHQGSAQ